MKKLTPRMIETLQELAAKGEYASYMPYRGRFGGAYWFISPGRSCTAQVRGLIDRGLLTVTSKSPFGDKTTARINDIGRRLLEAIATV